jgi:hypothetical protein
MNIIIKATDTVLALTASVLNQPILSIPRKDWMSTLLSFGMPDELVTNGSDSKETSLISYVMNVSPTFFKPKRVKLKSDTQLNDLAVDIDRTSSRKPSTEQMIWYRCINSLRNRKDLPLLVRNTRNICRRLNSFCKVIEDREESLMSFDGRAYQRCATCHSSYHSISAYCKPILIRSW